MTMFIRWFSTHRSRPALLSCLNSRLHLPCSSVSVSILPLEQSCGARRYGLHLILLHPAQVLRYLLSVNILTGRKGLIKHWVSPRDALCLKWRGFNRWSFFDQVNKEQATTHSLLPDATNCCTAELWWSWNYSITLKPRSVLKRTLNFLIKTILRLKEMKQPLSHRRTECIQLKWLKREWRKQVYCA